MFLKLLIDFQHAGPWVILVFVKLRIIRPLRVISKILKLASVGTRCSLHALPCRDHSWLPHHVTSARRMRAKHRLDRHATRVPNSRTIISALVRFR